MADDETYVEINVTVLRMTRQAVQVADDNRDIKCWIPRSLIHGADETRLNSRWNDLPCEMTLRIFEWKAKREDLI